MAFLYPFKGHSGDESRRESSLRMR